MNRMIKFEEIEQLKNAKRNYEDSLNNLEKALTFYGATFYFSGHQSRDIGTEIIPCLKEAYVNYFKTKCEVALLELSNLDVDVRKEKEDLDKINVEQ